jgi:hypothetical protein
MAIVYSVSIKEKLLSAAYMSIGAERLPRSEYLVQ